MRSLPSLAVLIWGTIFFAAPPLQASEIAFAGEITNITCSVKINGITGPLVIYLPTVKVSDLPTHNSTAGTTEFIVELYNCSEIYQGYVKVASLPIKVMIPGIAGYPGGPGKPAHYLPNMATVNAAKGVHFYLEAQYWDGSWDSIYAPYGDKLLGVLVDHFRPGMKDMVKKGRVSYVRDTTPETGSVELVPGVVQSAVQYSLVYD